MSNSSSDVTELDSGYSDSDVAIIGLDCRFPGASNYREFWSNLEAGVESIKFFSDEEMAQAGIPESDFKNERYVAAASLIEDADCFDHAFFGFSPSEGALMDPQQRVYLESAWHALEDAGYGRSSCRGLTGIWAGSAMNSYLLRNLLSNRGKLSASEYQIMILNDKDYLATRAAFKLDLQGPAVTVQSACSTSLVAVHMASQALINGECDMALAGGVCVRVPFINGYHYQEGMILSSDGHCRPFDADATGTLGGNGVGNIVLKRVKDAIVDGDTIRAVIRGSAVNNDGANKVGFTAPSVEGQAECIAEAMSMAGVEPIDYVYLEAHGTGTQLGDPIEIAALKKAFSEFREPGDSEESHYCGVGSVKSNFGHLDAAAGIAGLIKAILVLQHQAIPANLHFKSNNPALGLDSSPFYINDQFKALPSQDNPLIAGVSSFGIGGTNAHVIIEEPPALKTAQAKSKLSHHILRLSAKSQLAVDRLKASFANFLESEDTASIEDICFTLNNGREHFAFRHAIVCQNKAMAAEQLRTKTSASYSGHVDDSDSRRSKVVFMFPGQGAQYPKMCLGLYETNSLFAQVIDECCTITSKILERDLKPALFSAEQDEIDRTEIAQPLLFITEYALAQVWISRGLTPDVMIGHSLGEITAACLAGVFSLTDALQLVCERGRMMQSLPEGDMLAVEISEADAQVYLSADVSIAGINSDYQCVFSGAKNAIDQLITKFPEAQRLNTSHAFHSQMMLSITDAFSKMLSSLSLSPPKLSWVSNVTGDWITAEQAQSTQYWLDHILQPVRFADGVACLQSAGYRIFLECGPGNVLNNLVRRNLEVDARQDLPVNGFVYANSLPRRRQAIEADLYLQNNVAKLWANGVDIDPGLLPRSENKEKQSEPNRAEYRRVALPSYSFEPTRCWIDAADQGVLSHAATVDNSSTQPNKITDRKDWFYSPSWHRRRLSKTAVTSKRLLVLIDGDTGAAAEARNALVKELRNLAEEVITVSTGDHYVRSSAHEFCIRANCLEDYTRLFQSLDSVPARIVHGWSVNCEREDSRRERGLFSLYHLFKALDSLQLDPASMELIVLSKGVDTVTADENLGIDNAELLGPVRTAPREMPGLKTRLVDVDDLGALNTVTEVARELVSKWQNEQCAFRQGRRWVRAITPVVLDETANPLVMNGTYLLTGGLGGVGLAIAKYLASQYQAKLILVGRSAIPEKSEWAEVVDRDENEKLVSTLKALLEIEVLGGQVLCCEVDICDTSLLTKTLASVEETFGVINGIFHGAGIAGGGMMTLRAQGAIESVMAPKVEGLKSLIRVFEGRSLDFMALFSSISAEMGDFGQADYSAANAYMDSAADALGAADIRIIAINWDTWVGLGMSGKGSPEGAVARESGLSVEDALGVLPFVLGSGLSRLIISTELLSKRFIRLAQESEPEFLKAKNNTDANDLHSDNTLLPQVPRPSLVNPFVEANTEIEKILGGIWQRLLGFERIGIEDDFFELGGHSLLAVQVISELEEKTGIKLSLTDFFEHPIILEIAVKADDKTTIETDRDSLEALLAEVETLPEEDILQLLEEKK
jgi:acyl transferase domain-containing protein/acyl carrier protein